MTVNEFVSGPVPAPIVVGGRVGYVVKNLSPDTILHLAAAPDTAVAADLAVGRQLAAEAGRINATIRDQRRPTVLATVGSFGTGHAAGLLHWALTYD